MDPTLVPGTRFESQFQICVYEHAILRIYISFFQHGMLQDIIFICLVLPVLQILVQSWQTIILTRRKRRL